MDFYNPRRFARQPGQPARDARLRPTLDALGESAIVVLLALLACFLFSL
jgi:hypothetical protein